MAITGTNIEVVIDVVITELNRLIGAGRFGSPSFGRGDDGEGGNGGGHPGSDNGGMASFGSGRWVRGLEG